MITNTSREHKREHHRKREMERVGDKSDSRRLFTQRQQHFYSDTHTHLLYDFVTNFFVRRNQKEIFERVSHIIMPGLEEQSSRPGG